jgi:CRISPR/Cas system-associated exonuclease Cas4 (RecB family)
MTKNLLHTIMIKPEEQPIHPIDVAGLIQKIQEGYTIKRVDKHTTKKTFAPSTIAFGHGECPRYWYLAFDGQMFEDNADAYSAANMTAGSLSHARIQAAMMNSKIAKIYKDDEGEDTTEFKVRHDDPPIFGYGDVMLDWQGEELIGEIKTMMNEGFEYRKTKNKAKSGHLMQLLIYMKIFKRAKGVLIYENKNNHELLILPVEVNDHYRRWVDQAFDWMREVRKNWENQTLPTKNYRSNSKICKSCPIKKACESAGTGVVKLKSLEVLGEELQMV